MDEKGPQLWVERTPSLLLNRYHADPSGTLMRYDAKAIGSGSEGAQTELQEHYHKVPVSFSCLNIQTLSLTEAMSLALKVLKSVMEEKLSASNVQVATVTAEQGYKVATEAELEPLVAALF